jgi:hypothetical protein
MFMRLIFGSIQISLSLLCNFCIHAPVAAATAVFLIYPIGQGSFSQHLPFSIKEILAFV